MSDKLSVEHGAVTTHVQSLQQHNQSLQEQSQRFLDVVEPLKGTWKGTSATPWEQITAAWVEAMGNVNKALDQLADRVEAAGKAYRSGEEEQTQTLQNRFSGMDLPQGNIL